MSEHPATILLVRHGHVEGIDPPRFRGRTELALTAQGHRQAEALRDRIAAEWQPMAAYSSPMGRCRTTAEVLAQPFGIAVAPDPDLNDFDYGEWQGLSHADVEQRWPSEYAIWHKAPHQTLVPGGENLHRVAERATRALHAIAKHHAGQSVIVVAHDSVNRVLLLRTLELPLSRYWSIVQAPCCLNVLDCEDGRFTIHTINETGHLLAR